MESEMESGTHAIEESIVVLDHSGELQELLLPEGKISGDG